MRYYRSRSETGDIRKIECGIERGISADERRDERTECSTSEKEILGKIKIVLLVNERERKKFGELNVLRGKNSVNKRIFASV